MRRFVIIAALFLLSIHLALPAQASPCKQSRNATTGRYERANRTAIGFHSTKAPIGLRLGLVNHVGLDLGAGFSSEFNRDQSAFDVGVPITVKSWRGARALFRPGVLYERCELPNGDRKTTTLSAELEGEAFLIKDFSVSAAFGVAHRELDSPNAIENESFWTTTGGEFTRVGVHLYLWR